MSREFGQFDTMLLSQARLGIVSVLVTRHTATFTELKELVGLTQGNLTIHLGKLEDCGYVEIEKKFVGKKPRTTASITDVGREAFLDHVEQLQAIAKQGNS